MTQPQVVAVLPDIASIDRTFNYRVPKKWSWDTKPVIVGTKVRVDLHSRRVPAWVIEVDPEDSSDYGELQELKIWSGYGPSDEVVKLCYWAAQRWISSPSKLLTTASPPKKVSQLTAHSCTEVTTAIPTAEQSQAQSAQISQAQSAQISQAQPTGQVQGQPVSQILGSPAAQAVVSDSGIRPSLAQEAFKVGIAAVELAPAADRWPYIEEAIKYTNPLILTPTAVTAQELVQRLHKRGHRVALWPRDWQRAASGAITVGTRSAAFASVANLGAILVLDEFGQEYRSQQSPTWHAVSVTQERARNTRIPWVGLSPCISALTRYHIESPEPIQHQKSVQEDPKSAINKRILTAPKVENQNGWPIIEIVDRSERASNVPGLFSSELVRQMKEPGRVACILNRLGRIRLLACKSCEQILICESCSGAVHVNDDNALECRRCGAQRPKVCSQCASIQLKNLVLGIGRAQEELSALLREPVGSYSADEIVNAQARVVIGTQALLNQPTQRSQRFSTVAFLDFDQHLFNIERDAEQNALELITRAARQLGQRSRRGRMIIQTRAPEHHLLKAVTTTQLSHLSRLWLEQRRELNWPPITAEAQISLTGAQKYVDEIRKLTRPGSDTVALSLFDTAADTGEQDSSRRDELQRLADTIEILETGPDRYHLRADSQYVLTTVLNAIDRPKQRTRIALY